MSSAGFTEFQEAFVWIFGPLIAWLFAGAAASGFIAGVTILWLHLLQYLSRR